MFREEKQVYIPHLKYTVWLLDKSRAEGKSAQKFDEGFVAVTEKMDGQSAIFADLNTLDLPTLAHEIEHVLQYIAEYYNMDYVKEKENLAYLSEYLTKELTS